MWDETAPDFITAYLTGQNISISPTQKCPNLQWLTATSPHFHHPTFELPRTAYSSDVFVPTGSSTQRIETSQEARNSSNVECELGKPCKEVPAGAPVLVWIYGGGYNRRG